MKLTIAKFLPSSEPLHVGAALPSDPPPNTQQFSRSRLPLNWNFFDCGLLSPLLGGRRASVFLPQLLLHPQSSFLLEENRTILDRKVIPEANKMGTWQRPAEAS